MPESKDKYFWDGVSGMSEEFKLKRMFEYASFPDLLSYPLDNIKKYISVIDIGKLRTSEKRKAFIKLIIPLLPNVQDWDDLFDELLTLNRKNRR